MKSSMRLMKHICLSLTAIMAANGAWAQGTALSLRTMQLGGDDMPEAWVRSAEKDKKVVQLTWQESQPTLPIKVLHDGQLKLFKYTTNEDGETVPEITDVIKLPSSAKEVLLLAWCKDGKAKYVAIKDQFLNAKFNDWIAINTSSNPVALKAGDKSNAVKVGAGQSVLFSPDIREGKGVKMLAQTQREGELKTFLSSYWPAFAKQRTMIIFYDDGEKMRARRIGDRFVPKEEKKEGAPAAAP